MKLTITSRFLILAGLLISSGTSFSQTSYFGGKFEISNWENHGYDFKLYDFSREGATMRAKASMSTGPS